LLLLLMGNGRTQAEHEGAEQETAELKLRYSDICTVRFPVRLLMKLIFWS
jgi:hypothetical protein